MQPIGIIHTPFNDKFAIPRQPRLAPAARGVVELLPPFDEPLALAGLEQVSHVWLLFQFHAVPEKDSAQRLRVRPPRLGGNTKIGVFASRSTHRPSGIGMSLVKLDAIDGSKLKVSGVDILNGTPIIDIKPYIPFSDSAADAYNHIAEDVPERIAVSWNSAALQQALAQGQEVVELVEQCLAQDPKPAYQEPSPERRYAARFWDLNISWHYLTAKHIEVLAVDF